MNEFGNNSPLHEHIGWQVFVLSFLAFIFGAGTAAISAQGSLIGFVGLGGVTFSSVHLCSMWAVLGPGRYLVTASLSLLFCLVIISSALFGIWASVGIVEPIELIRLLAGCPLIWVVNQIPFWVLRIFFNWRIRHHRFRNHVLSIGELIGLTTMTAISLGVAKYISQDRQWQNRQFDDFWQFMISFTISLQVSFLFICIPAMIFFLKPANFNSHSRWFVLYVVAVVFFLIAITFATIDSGIGLMLLAVFIAVGSVFGGALFIHSQNGIYLTIGRQKELE